jgi:hypothetical protein
MSSYLIPNVEKVNDTFLKKGTYIVLTEVNKKPPHLSLLIEGQLFSLGVKGPKLGLPLEIQLKYIKSRKIQALFIKLNISIHIQDNQLFKEVKKHTLMYSKAEVGIATCLSPIKNFCAGIFNVDVSEVNLIFDLLPILYERNLIDACYQYNLDLFLKGNSFYLEKYTLKDIFDSISLFQISEAF